MKIIDYEKKYKDALSRAKGMWEQGMMPERIEYIFPELKESKEKQGEQKPILEIFGFKIGDIVRLKDGDGRKHIIKSFEEVKGIHGPNFYQVEFEDNSARDGIYPDDKYPNGYYTKMEKFEKEQKPADKGQKPTWSEEDEADFSVTMWAM